MAVNTKQQAIRKLTTSDREALQKEYFRLFRRGLLSVVAEKVGCNRSTVWHTFHGHYQTPNPKIEAALRAEIQRLTCAEADAGKCSECPIRSACDRMAGKG